MRRTFYYQFTSKRTDTIALEVTKNMTIGNLLSTIAKINRMENIKLHVSGHNDNELLTDFENNHVFRIKSGDQSSNQINTKSFDKKEYPNQKGGKEKSEVYSHYKKNKEEKSEPNTQNYDYQNKSADSSKFKNQKSSQKSENTESIEKTSSPNKNKSVSAYKPKIKPFDETKSPESKSKSKPPPQHKSKSSEKVKYFYQTNIDSKLHEVELDQKATVLTMKQQIANSNGVKNVKNVQIISAGNELLDEINLKSLEIGDAKLFAYIRREEDIVRLTAKALKFDKNASDSSEADF